jgi:chromosome segregation ATPase
VDDAEYNAKFLQQSVDDGKRRLANMESELFQLRKEKDDLQIGLRASTSELNQLKSQMSMISSERNSVSSNFDKTKQEIGQLRDEVRDLQLAKNSVEQVARSLRLELVT